VQQNGGCLFDSIPADRVGLNCLHGNDISTEIAKVIDVVNKVEENRTSTFLAPPGGVKILVRLIKPTGAMNGQNLTQPP
jgi:hypothetical protein